MEMKEREAVYLGPGEGRALRVLGELVKYKVTANQTGGAYSLFEVEVPPGGGPPPHVQHHEDENFYVLVGEFEFLADDEAARMGAGSLVYVPKGALHTYTNVGAESGRLLVIQTPGGIHERFFEEIGAKMDKNTPPDIERLIAVATKYGIEIPPEAREERG